MKSTKNTKKFIMTALLGLSIFNVATAITPLAPGTNTRCAFSCKNPKTNYFIVDTACATTDEWRSWDGGDFLTIWNESYIENALSKIPIQINYSGLVWCTGSSECMDVCPRLRAIRASKCGEDGMFRSATVGTTCVVGNDHLARWVQRHHAAE